MTENNNVVLSQELAELVSQLKVAQAEVENLLSEKVTEASVKGFRKFEKLLRKTSETENFSSSLTKEQKQHLKVVLSDATKTYNDFVKQSEIRINTGKKTTFECSSGTVKTDFEIVVFGLEGAGKKSFAKLISDPDYEQLKEQSKFKFKINIATIVDDKKLEKLFSSKKPFGIVNVVSYGYAFPKHLKYENIVAPGKILEDYLAERRKEEINLLKDFLSGLRDAKACWFVTLISKADLWHQQRGQVEKYYQEGEYADMFNQVSVKANNFAHRYVPASLVLLNAYSSDHKLLAYVESGCDGLFKDESINKLFGAMEDLSSIF